MGPDDVALAKAPDPSLEIWPRVIWQGNNGNLGSEEFQGYQLIYGQLNILLLFLILNFVSGQLATSYTSIVVSLPRLLSLLLHLHLPFLSV